MPANKMAGARQSDEKLAPVQAQTCPPRIKWFLRHFDAPALADKSFVTQSKVQSIQVLNCTHSGFTPVIREGHVALSLP
jgi:hypothetical protein